MKLHHFEEVVAIAERGGIRGAARALGVAQPALTRSLADLERELGSALFERRARGVIPTPMGEAFVRRATLILQEIRRAREEADQIRGEASGMVTVGLSIAAHLSLLPSALAPFRARYPNVRLHIIEGFYPTLETGLRDGAVDFYIGPDPGRKVMAELDRDVLFEGRRTVLCRVGHPLASVTSLAGLRDADWVTTSITSDAADEIGAIFERHKLPSPRLALRSQSALTLMTCLSNSDLLAMTPIQWSKFELVRGVLTTINVKEELAAPAIVLVKRRDLPLTPAATFLLDLLLRARDRMSAPVNKPKPARRSST